MQCGKTRNSSPPFVLVLVVLSFSVALGGHSYPRFSRNDTVFQHLALHPDPAVGTVFVGARDHLFQLDGSDGLRLEQEERTGPVSDSRDCLPPVTELNCPQARRTSNHNKLLLVDPQGDQLITCGSVHQGVCQKRSLASVRQVLFSAERPVDTQYVAANDPSVSTVGLVVGPRGAERAVLYVGRGYTASHPPISTRHLSAEPVFSYEETAKLAVAGRLSEYDHHFVAAFARRAHVYFLFYRRDIKASREYRTYAARVCLEDTSFYSYVEVPLVCRSSTSSSSSSSKTYNLLQAAQVGHSGGREGEALLGVFSARVSSTNSNPSDASALCVFPLDELDSRIASTRDLCYTQDGRVEGGGEAVAYIEYEVKSSCANLPTNTLKAYPCGSDHTPSPMASRTALEAEAVLDSPAARLTAVAVSVRDGHSIAFLGDADGKLHKVFLGPGGEVEMYASATIHPNSPINSDLLLDQTGAHIYIMSSTAVEKRPVAECGDHHDCQSCLAARDPYCGWCALEGRCGQRWQCHRGSVEGHWLWSFDRRQQCLSIQDLSLYNISRGEKTDITVSVAGLPSLAVDEAYSCFFHDTETPAYLSHAGVTCSTPDASGLPPIGQGDDSVMVTLSLRFLNVTVAETDFTFYNCSLVQQLSGRRPCHGCVSSRWGCNWCIHQHVCTHQHTCSHGTTVYNQNFKRPTRATSPPPTKQPPTLPPPVPATTTTSTSTLPLPTEPPEPTAGPSTPPPPPLPTPELMAVPTTMPPTLGRTLPSISLSTQATTAHLEPTTEESIPDGVTEGNKGDDGDALSPVVEDEKGGGDAVLSEAESPVTPVSAFPEFLPETTLPSGANGQAEPSGEAVDSSGVRPTAAPSEAVLVAEKPADSDGGEAVPLSNAEGNDAAAWVREWETAERELEVVLAAGPSVAGASEQTFIHARSSEPDIAEYYQSDSTSDSHVPECPCVDRIQGSSLIPVNAERKVTLVGQHLQLFEDKELDYECVFDIEERLVVVDAVVETDVTEPSIFLITCQLYQYAYSALLEEYQAMVSVRRKNNFLIDSTEDLHVTLFNCSVGRSDCSRCRTADPKYGCAWCAGASGSPRCVYQESCSDQIQHTCPAPVIHFMDPVSGPVEGGTVVTISGSNLGQRAEDIQNSVTVAGVPCTVIHSRYEVSSRIVCETTGSGGEKSGQAAVKVRGGGHGLSAQTFSFQDPILSSIFPHKGPKAGGSALRIRGRRLRTGQPSEISVLIGGVPCVVSDILDEQIICLSGSSNKTGEHGITVRFAGAERHLQGVVYHYTPDPNITVATPSKSFLKGGRIIRVKGHNLDVVQEPKIRVTLSPPDTLPPRRRRRRRRRQEGERGRSAGDDEAGVLTRRKRIVPEPGCPEGAICHVHWYDSRCTVSSSSLILCPTPSVGPEARRARIKVDFLLDSLHFDFNAVGNEAFSYEPNPELYPLNQNDPGKPYHHKPGSIISVEVRYHHEPGSIISVEGENLDLAIYKEEVVALIGEGVCAVKTLTHNHLYCEPPSQQPSVVAGRKLEGVDSLPEFTVRMGNLNFSLGRVQYDSQALSTFPLEAQVGVGVGASIVALIVLIIVLIYRRKSKQAMRDYKKVQIQLENLETSVRDRCKKEFTDLMTEMMDMSSDLVGSGIPFLDYKAYAERIFFPGHRDSPLRRDLDVPESRRQTVEQGLVQLSNLLNSKLFLTKFIHTLEVQRTFSPRDRAYVASLLTVALHGKLEYFTDILKTLLNDLVEQYVAKNPKLMLRRTESVVEKLLTNWMSICLFTFLRESAGESFYMLFRAIKHQVDKGPVDAVTGKAKYTLNDNRLLREDVEYRTLTLNVQVPPVGGTGVAGTQTVPAKVLDCDTITQVKEKLLEQTSKGTSFSQRPHADSLHLEWRAGVAGHLILSDEDLTSVVQGSWKRLNTLQHYKVPDGATVALVPRNTKHRHHESHDYIPGEKTPMLDDGEEGGVRLWHLVKASEEAELPKHRRGSVRERGGERAKAIPEIYLTRLLSMKGTLQKFVDDLFTAILSTSRPVPLAVKYFFDMLDEQALQHNITDPETIHIWKTNSLPLRFWINILKNPQFIFDIQASDHVDAVLSVIAQTFMDSCTIADHKLGRDSPINKLLYARDIPRYKQMVERYYADIRQTISASDQEMNSALAELSRNYAGEVNYLVALHELYKYINKYYDQIITALEEDTTAQKMQLGYRLQQIAAAVENKVTDL